MTDTGPVGPTRRTNSTPPHPAAVAYDRDVAPFTRPFANRVALQLRRMVGPSLDGVLLDHGCGTGLLARQVNDPAIRKSGATWRVYGLDPSAQLLSAAPTAEQASWFSAQVGTAADLPERQRFAAVASNLVLPFVGDALADLSAVRLRMKHGAPIVIATLGQADEVEPFHAFWSCFQHVEPTCWSPDQYVHFTYGSNTAVSSVLEQTGFSGIHTVSISGVRRISAERAWAWLSRALPVGFTASGVSGYQPVPDNVAQAARLEFLATFGARTRWRTTCRLTTALAGESARS